MNEQHTPGPWRYRVGDEWSHSVVTDDGELPDGSPNSWVVATINTRRDEKEANAHLIAAAPNLLAFALEYLDSCKDGEGGSATNMRMASAAIAKATGARHDHLNPARR